MATVSTNAIRVQNAKNMKDTLTSGGAAPYSYVAIAKPTEWEQGDENPPTPSNNVAEYNDLFYQMLSLKKLADNDIFMMIKRIQWTSGITFDMYRHDYSTTNPSFSGATNIYDCRFYAVNQNRDVYVCLNNNNGNISTVEPINSGDSPFTTADGYQWIRIYSIPAEDYTYHSTSNLLPIVENQVVGGVSGAVYTAVINNPGNGYTTSPEGATNQIPYYFCNINGDGEGAVARVGISIQGMIETVEIVRQGSGYTRANVDFRANEVYRSLTELDEKKNALNPLGDGTFDSTIIINPPNGWGHDLSLQLGAVKVAAFSNLNYSDTDFLVDITYRQLAILRGTTFTDGYPETANATYAVKLTTINSSAEQYRPGEEISQTVTVDGINRLAKGTVIEWGGLSEVSGVLTYFQDPNIHTDENGALYPFQGNSYVIGSTTGKIGAVDDFDLTDQDRQFVNGYSSPEVTPNTGELLYLSNFSPIQRLQNQTERVTIIISF